MTLKEYLKVLEVKDPIEQLKILGYNTQKMTVGKANKLVEAELNLEYKEKQVKRFTIEGRTFNCLYDINDLQIQEYAYYKSLIGDIYSNQVDSEDNEIEVDESIKYKKLFTQAHKIIAIFTKEKTLLKKHLDFSDKCELFSNMNIQMLINILFFYLNVIGNLTTNGSIYYIQTMEKLQM